MDSTRFSDMEQRRQKALPLPRCAQCMHRPDDRQAIEQRVPGLIVFGSGYGASVGTSRLCLLHDRLVSPDDACARFSSVDI